MKPIPNYDGYYITEDGRVWSDKCNKYLSQYKMPNGYLRVILCKDNIPKQFYVHRLVATVFIENPNNYLEVNHKDENKMNNHYENLEWCTHHYNNNYGSKINCIKGERNPNCKLTEEQVKSIRKEHIPFSRTNGTKALSIKYNVCESTITGVLNRTKWGWLN